jgi:hypothetical protein
MKNQKIDMTAIDVVLLGACFGVFGPPGPWYPFWLGERRAVWVRRLEDCV